MACDVLGGNQPLVTRAEALAQGLTRYYTGQPCLRGHVAERKTSNCCCLACKKERVASFSGLVRTSRSVPQKGLPSSYAEARTLGLPYYFTGRSCKRGHIAPRAAATGNCNACGSEARVKSQMANREVTYARGKAWRDANPDRVKATQQRSAAKLTSLQKAERRERRNESGASRRYYAGNKEKHRVLVMRRRAREIGADGAYTADEFAALVAKQGYRCVYCRASLRKQRPSPDHIVPLCDGGSNAISNIQATCWPCNRLKNRKDPIVFAQGLGRLL